MDFVKTTFYFKEKVIQQNSNINSKLPKAEHIVNERIPYNKVFVIDENGEKIGVMLKTEAIEKANISYKELENIEKINKIKFDKFYKYLDEEIKEKLNNFDYDENYSEIEVKKINGKWELEYDFNTYLNEIMNGFNTNDD